MRDMFVSVIVTTKNEEAVLERLLQSTQRQTYKNIEIVVVDNRSSDKTKEITRRFTDKIFDFGPERSSQRNFGAKKAKGEYLLVLDADMKLSPKVIEECVKLAESDKNIGAVTIPEKSVAKTFWEKVKAFERSFYNLEGDVTTDAARFFRKDVFEKMGGYDETITGPEDWDLPERIRKSGYEISRIKSRIYHYERIPSLWSLVKKKYYYGLKAHRYLEKQTLSPVSAKTIYFLRPVFYRQWRRLVSSPVLSGAMFFMFTAELVGGGLGYLVGKTRNK